MVAWHEHMKAGNENTGLMAWDILFNCGNMN